MSPSVLHPSLWCMATGPQISSRGRRAGGVSSHQLICPSVFLSPRSPPVQQVSPWAQGLSLTWPWESYPVLVTLLK